jgi:hypothetical protein
MTTRASRASRDDATWDIFFNGRHNHVVTMNANQEKITNVQFMMQYFKIDEAVAQQYLYKNKGDLVDAMIDFEDQRDIVNLQNK